MVTAIDTTISGSAVTGGGLCRLFFEDPSSDGDLDNCIDAVADFWTTLCTILDDDVTFQIQSDQPRYAAETGELQQVFARPVPGASTGANAGNSVPRAAQGMIRWTTESIVNGRLLRGRTYIPGMPSASLTDTGLLSSSYSVTLQAAADQLLTDTNNLLVVWHRPLAGAGGETHIVMSASVWDQFAMLRSRRD